MQATQDDLGSVDTTNPLLKPVATITLDEEPPPEPSATQLLNPIDDVPTDPKQKAQPRPTKAQAPVLDVSVDGAATLKKKRAPLKADAFESFGALPPLGEKDGPRGAPAPWEKPAVWTPALVALTVVGVLMLLLAVVLLLRG